MTGKGSTGQPLVDGNQQCSHCQWQQQHKAQLAANKQDLAVVLPPCQLKALC